MMKRFKKYNGKILIYESYNKLLKSWGVDKEEFDVETTFGLTHIIVAGNRENPPLVLFHGVGDNSAIMWIYNIQALAQHFFVLMVDTIGGPGKSEPNQMYYDKFDLFLWIDELLNHFSISTTNLAGVSNGAYIVQYYAIKNPEKVNKLVCMAGSIAEKGMPNPIFRMMKIFLPEALFPTKKNTIKLLKKLCGSNNKVFIEKEDIIEHWGYLLKHFNNRTMMYHKYVQFERSQIESIKDKSLFLIGDCDKLTYYPEAIQALERNSLNFKIIENAGHGINHEQSAIVNNEVISFLHS